MEQANNILPTVTPAPASVAGEKEKCSFRSCKVTGALKLDCTTPDCDKKVHYMCYQGLILKKFNDLHPLQNGQAACTKRCHAKAIKAGAGGGDEEDGGGRKGNWDCDAVDESSKTSVQILLDWWMTEGNYSKYCGKNNNGIKKIQFCQKLADKMTKETRSVRDARNVLCKIQHIERSFRDAHVFANSETGAGIREENEGSFKNAVERKRPYYYDLLDVMNDRASSKPKALSYDDASDADDLLGIEEENDKEDDAMSKLSDKNENKSVSTKRTASTSSSRKSHNKKKKSSPIMDDDAIAALSKASQTSKAKMKELVRHHQFLENLEERKLHLEQQREARESNKGKLGELEYKMRLIEKYKELKEKYGWNDNQIVAFLPDMRQVVEAQENEVDN
jgi:hypothetical protein